MSKASQSRKTTTLSICFRTPVGESGAKTGQWNSLVSTPPTFETGCGNTSFSVNKRKACNTYKWLPQSGPLYLAIMLNMTGSVDGFPFILRPFFLFSPIQSHCCTLNISRPYLTHSLRCSFLADYKHNRAFR